MASYTPGRLASDVSTINLKLLENGSTDRVMLVSELLAMLHGCAATGTREEGAMLGELITVIKEVSNG